MISVVTLTAWFFSLCFLSVMQAFFEGFEGTSASSGPDWMVGLIEVGAFVVSSAGLGGLVGLAFFGVAMVRANVLPRWAAVMFALGLPLGAATVQDLASSPLLETQLHLPQFCST
jgi:hypothetical protein